MRAPSLCRYKRKRGCNPPLSRQGFLGGSHTFETSLATILHLCGFAAKCGSWQSESHGTAGCSPIHAFSVLKHYDCTLASHHAWSAALAISDDHPGLKRAIREVVPEAIWQRCYVHFLRNALDYLPCKTNDDCLLELRWLYDRRNVEKARRDLAAWMANWAQRYPKLCVWVEENIEETLSFYRLPRQHHKNLKSTNMLERIMEEIKRRKLAARIFPNAAGCLWLVRALAVEMHEN